MAYSLTASSGTISIADGGTAVTGVDTAFAMLRVEGGFLICEAGYGAIASVESDTALTLEEPLIVPAGSSGGAVTGGDYLIYRGSSNAADAVRAYDQLTLFRQLVEQITVSALTRVSAFGADLAGRDAYDDEWLDIDGNPFVYAYVDSNGNPVYYAKIDETSGNWTDAFNFNGPAGLNGENGAALDFNGSGVPSSGLGTDGQTYVNIDNGDTYLKSGGSWTLEGSIRGPQGDVTPEAEAAVEAAEGFADDAEVFADEAEVAKVAAELAETNAIAAAAMSGTIYANEATGRAAVTDGDFYLAIGSTSEKAIDIWQRDDAANSTLIRSYYDLSGTAQIVEDYEYSKYISSKGFVTNKILEGTGTIAPALFDARTWVNTTSYTITAYVKKAGNYIVNFLATGAIAVNATFNLDTNTVVGTGSPTIKAIGNGWFKCQVTVVATATNSANFQLRVLNANQETTYTGAGVNGMLVDKLTCSVTGTDAEFFVSSDISDASWNQNGGTVVPATVGDTIDGNRLENTYKAVFGTMTGDKIVEGTGSITPTLYRNSGIVTNAADYVVKLVAKAGERTLVNLFNNQALNYNCTFDLVNGIATGAGSSITHLGEGWFECRVDVTAVGTTAGNCQIRPLNGSYATNYTGDGVSGLYLNSHSFTKDGIEVFTTAPSRFASSYWTKSGLTVNEDVELFRTFKLGGLNVTDPEESVAYFTGKKWAALGTSITEQGYYTSVLNSLLGTTLQNLGVSGGSIASGGHYGSLAIYDEIANIDSDTALVTIEAGINDFGTDNSTIGVLGDTTTATFYGALYAAVAAIRAQAPDARIVFFTPYGGDSRSSTRNMIVTNGNGYKLLQFQNAVRDVANYLGLPCINVGGDAGIGYLTGILYLSDGLHLDTAGGRRYGNYVKAKLDELAVAGFLV